MFLYISLISNLGILGCFKYFNFFIDSFNSSFGYFGYDLDFLHLNIILPVGISFYTFQTLTYTIDIYKEKLEPTKSFINFALYVSFFPQLVAGPIERAKNLLPQVSNLTNPTADHLRKGFVLISIGLFRKIIIGDTCGRIVDQIFAEPSLYDSIELVMGLVLFSFQIYNDFAGYSSIARGTANLLGVDLMENFNQPYLASNITEFWRRWHISLSSWLKDYLYITLGGNRKGNVRTYINLMITMLLGGLWHGANWTFVVWGGLHGIYLAIHKLILRNQSAAVRYSGGILNIKILQYSVKVLSTYLIVLFTWLFFRSESFSNSFLFISNIVNWTTSVYTDRIIGIILSYALLSYSIDIFEYYFKDHTFMLRLKSPIRYAILSSMWLFSLIYLFQAEPMPFIYFQF
jgi:D-alanyl-lipoteichoic acid acyltransferase DltB (MBOAT superfamily)